MINLLPKILDYAFDDALPSVKRVTIFLEYLKWLDKWKGFSFFLI